MNLQKQFDKHVGEPDDNGCIIWKGFKRTFGYGGLEINGKKYSAHRIAWVLKHGEIPYGMNVLHKCDNPACCNVDHLFLGTLEDNVHDCVKKKRHARGEKSGQAKLTNKDVLTIRLLRDFGYSEKYLAKLFGVHRTNINYICNGVTWKHL